MTKRLNRLEPVQRLKQHHERDAAKKLGDDQRALDEQQQRLNDLLSYRDEYVARYQTALASGRLVGMPMQEYRVFLDRLDQAIEQQRQSIRHGEDRREQSRLQWLRSRTEVRAIETVIERRRSELEREQLKREQAEADERAQHRRHPDDKR